MSQQDKKIDLPTAKAWTKEWRNEESDYNKYNECNAFLIPVQDLQGVLAEMGNPPNGYVRAYLGVETNNNTKPPTQTEKLIIVGTTAEAQPDGKTIYRDRLPSDGAGDGNGGSLWDFTDPCPPDCDPNSPLN